MYIYLFHRRFPSCTKLSSDIVITFDPFPSVLIPICDVVSFASFPLLFRTNLLQQFYCRIILLFQHEVFDAELHAVHEGLSFLATSDFSPRNLVICIDSTAAVGTLQDNNSNSEPARVASTLASLLVQKGWKISSLWTPAHRKIERNEHADEMAKKGAESSLNLCPRSF
jgi:hypothetical protein